jgi:hypothetical protein
MAANTDGSDGPRIIFKDLRRAGDLPACGTGGLFVRPYKDVAALEPNDLVHPLGGGMSVTPDDPMLMPQSRKPRSLGGTSRKSIWSLEVPILDEYDLSCRRDRRDHALVEVAKTMKLQQTQNQLCRTASRWELAYE